MSQLSLIDAPTPPPQEIPHSLVTVVVPPLEGEYLYAFDPIACPEMSVGCMIEVQLGRRPAPGFVISANSDRERAAAKEIAERGVKIKPIPSSSRPIKAFT